MVKGGELLHREAAVEKIVESMGKYDIVVASTGFHCKGALLSI